MSEWLEITTEDGRVVKLVHPAWTVPITVEMGLDVGWWPWLRADYNPMPSFVPFPRLARVQSGMRFWRWRVADAWRVLRHGLPEDG